MKTNYNYELIKDYLDSILDSETSREMKNLIATDETARGIAKGILQLKSKFKEDSEIDQYLDQLHSKNEVLIKNKLESSRSVTFLRIAASILLIAISGVLAYQFSSSRPSLSDLVETELTQPYTASITLRNSDNTTNLDQALASYNQGKYLEAAELLKDLESSRATFFRGICFLYAGKYQQAVRELEKDTLEGSRFTEQGRWYLAITHIKSGESSKAEEILKYIVSEDSHFKQESATELLEALSYN